MLPSIVATLDRAAISPSGKYILVVVSEQLRGDRYYGFQIEDQERNVVYAAPERFGAQHMTYFLWDEADRVWVYSGDLGTFFWEKTGEAGEQWTKHTYSQSDVPAPQFLKEVRPRWHTH